ncbi:MAG TPA: solute carrier family 23 protein [Verrucomicrobiae bacterium]|nr:solute carrier family 23 protein [Verrucomicrobiae bacterium]
MPQKPANLVYGVDDRPGLGTTLALGFQHVFLMVSTLVLPAAIVQSVDGSEDQAERVIKMSMIAGGLATILQSLRVRGLGSGYLCPHLCGPPYLSASLLAVKTGGLSLLFTMTAIAGCFEAILARLIHRLRVFFPTEVTGLVVAMVGVALIPMGVRNFFGVNPADPFAIPHHGAVAALTLALMVGANVWGKGKSRLYCVLIGIIAGYGISFLSGILSPADVARLKEEPWIEAPQLEPRHWAFSWEVLLPFLIASICSVLKAMGDLTMCQKINDTQWNRPDMRSVSGGILAGALGNICSGLAGGMGQATSSSNIGASIATGATSRVIGFAAGGFFILLAFFPKVAAIFALLPRPVMGALLVFVTCFMVLSGIQIMMSRLLDARRTFTLGLALVFGLSVDMVPGLYRNAPHWLQPVVSSSLALATLSALVLHLIFRLGVTRRALLEMFPGTDSSEKIAAFLEAQGGAWGARKDVIAHASAALNEVFESLAGSQLARGPIQAHVTFDELSLDISVRYEGELLDLSAKSSPKTGPDNPADLAWLPALLVRKYSDRVKTAQKGSLSHIELHFDH